MGARLRRRTCIEVEGETRVKNLDKIIRILSESTQNANLFGEGKKATDYSVLASDTNSYELFFVHGKLETVRKSEHSSATATVYVDHDGKKGNASFGLDASADSAEIARKTAEAIARANMIFDAPYSIVADAQKVNAVIPSNIADKDEKEIGAAVAEAVYGACTKANCGINALEVFVTKTVSTVRNSAGVDKTQTKYTVSVEAIPTCDEKEESVELFETYTFGSVDLESIKREIAARIEDVSARATAVKPAEKISCPIILNPYELETLFEELVNDANYAQAYLNTSLHKDGDLWQTAPKGDKLNVTMKGVIPGSPHSNLFDREGTALLDRKIIEDGKIVAGFGTNRFAQYLGKQPTGALGCMEIECGTTPISEMLAKPHLECVYLSGLQVDLYNDYIGGEIRLAYYFDGEKRIPVTGIAMSGKLSEVLNSLTLSKEHATLGAYSGPEKIRLENMKIF